MSELKQRQPNGSSSSHSHSHSHNHGHGHSHGHGHDHDHAEESEALMAALRGSADRGSRITLVGMAANVGLLVAKGVAGWMLNSASLLADAAHSLSDLLSDIVTLICWNLSRRPASSSYPFGYGKYESVGSFLVSILLSMGAFGIGMHSYSILSSTVFPSSTPTSTSSHSHHSHSHSHSHSSGEDDDLDPRAALFALASVLVKEYLFRITVKVGKEENSQVLIAHAYHHRSDAFSSVVALVAIALSSYGLTWVDPIGGLLVAAMIGQHGASIGFGALSELVDHAPPSAPTTSSLDPIFSRPILPSSSPSTASELTLLSHRTLKSGPLTLIDLTVSAPKTWTLMEVEDAEKELVKRVREEAGEGLGKAEVRVGWRTKEEAAELEAVKS